MPQPSSSQCYIIHPNTFHHHINNEDHITSLEHHLLTSIIHPHQLCHVKNTDDQTIINQAQALVNINYKQAVITKQIDAMIHAITQLMMTSTIYCSTPPIHLNYLLHHPLHPYPLPKYNSHPLSQIYLITQTGQSKDHRPTQMLNGRNENLLPLPIPLNNDKTLLLPKTFPLKTMSTILAAEDDLTKTITHLGRLLLRGTMSTSQPPTTCHPDSPHPSPPCQTTFTRA